MGYGRTVPVPCRRFFHQIACTTSFELWKHLNMFFWLGKMKYPCFFWVGKAYFQNLCLLVLRKVMCFWRIHHQLGFFRVGFSRESYESLYPSDFPGNDSKHKQPKLYSGLMVCKLQPIHFDKEYLFLKFWIRIYFLQREWGTTNLWNHHLRWPRWPESFFRGGCWWFGAAIWKFWEPYLLLQYAGKIRETLTSIVSQWTSNFSCLMSWWYLPNPWHVLFSLMGQYGQSFSGNSSHKWLIQGMTMPQHMIKYD